jgi:hypothetical protein
MDSKGSNSKAKENIWCSQCLINFHSIIEKVNILILPSLQRRASSQVCK